jgi:hypothetical protein
MLGRKEMSDEWIFVDVIFLKESLKNFVENFYKKRYCNIMIKCCCGHKDLLFKFLKKYDKMYNTQFEESTSFGGYLSVAEHLYCPKCQSSSVYAREKELVMEGL